LENSAGMDNYLSERIRVALASALAKTREFPAAFTMAAKITDSAEQASALAAIAVELAAADDLQAARRVFDDAIGVARQDVNDAWRPNMLGEIATAQARSGFADEAVRTTETILFARDKYLPKIVETLIENGDRLHWKRLLVPCAYSIDAAH